MVPPADYCFRMKYQSVLMEPQWDSRYSKNCAVSISIREFSSSCAFSKSGFSGSSEFYGVASRNDVFSFVLTRKNKPKATKNVSIIQILQNNQFVFNLDVSIKFKLATTNYYVFKAVIIFTILPRRTEAVEPEFIAVERRLIIDNCPILSDPSEEIPVPVLPESSIYIPDGFRLPENFEIRLSHDGRPYYLDHTRRTTSWVRPILLPLHNDLPQGWEMRMNSEGRLFYIDHQNRRTTWNPPTITTPSSECSDLPIGWERRFDQKSGNYYFVDHNRRRTQWENPRNAIQEDPLPPGWKTEHSKSGILYYVNTEKNISTYQDPREGRAKGPIGALGVPIAYERAFHWKMARFHDVCTQRMESERYTLTVSRQNLLEDSYFAIHEARPRDLMRKLVVSFVGEEGLDYGGILKEWFQLVSTEFMNPSYCLFRYIGTGDYALHVNPNSGINPEHLHYFHFIGRFFAMALLHRQHISCNLSLSFLKRLVQKPNSVKDIEEFDPVLFQSLQWIMDNEVSDLGLTFSVDDDSFGAVKTIDLVENGREVDVTDDNKAEYVALMTDFICSNGIDEQFDAIISGFNQILPLNLLCTFDERELEVMLRGLNKVDIDDWHHNTIYKNCSQDSAAVVFFWRFVKEIDDEQRLRLIQFVTGTCHVPIGGFANLTGSQGLQKFTINMTSRMETNMLPVSHTCFNRLDLPSYKSYGVLRSKLMMAIEETEGFGNE